MASGTRIEILVDVGLVPFELLRSAGPEQVAAEAIPAVCERARHQPLAVVAVEQHDRVRRERIEERRQRGVEARERAIVAGRAEAPAAVRRQDLPRCVQLPEVQEEEPRRLERAARETGHELAAPRVGQVRRRRDGDDTPRSRDRGRSRCRAVPSPRRPCGSRRSSSMVASVVTSGWRRWAPIERTPWRGE